MKILIKILFFNDAGVATHIDNPHACQQKK